MSASPTRRLTRLLAFLRRNHRAAVTTRHIAQSIAEYGDDKAGRFLLARDLRMLRSRGMVATGLTEGPATNRDGVRIVAWDKPAGYVLTAAEYTALTAARRHLRRGAPVVSALPDGDPAVPLPAGFDSLLRLVRVCEEQGGDVSVSDLCRLLDLPRPAVLGLVEDLADLRDTGDARLFTTVADVYCRCPDCQADPDGETAASHGEALAVAVVRTDRAKPLATQTKGLGLDELGRFAYTFAEVQDRLALIDQALDGWAQTHSHWDVPHLQTAQGKLMHWRSHLLFGPTALRHGVPA